MSKWTSLINQFSQYFNPESNNGQNFWSDKNPVSSTLTNAYKTAQQFENSQPIQTNIPTGNKYSDALVNGVAGAYANMVPNMAKGGAKIGDAIGTNIGSRVFNNQPTPSFKETATKGLSGVANMGTSLMLASPASLGKAVVGNNARQGFVQAVGNGALNSGLIGGAYGGLNQIGQNPNQINWPQTAKDTAIGAGTGAVIGGGLAGLANLLAKAMKPTVNNGGIKVDRSGKELLNKVQATQTERLISRGKELGLKGDRLDEFIMTGGKPQTFKLPTKQPKTKWVSELGATKGWEKSGIRYAKEAEALQRKVSAQQFNNLIQKGKDLGIRGDELDEFIMTGGKPDTFDIPNLLKKK